MSSEEGFKMLVSTGIVTPPDKRSETQQTQPIIFTENVAIDSVKNKSTKDERR